ncbi:MAG: hypothetical protein SNJ77_00995 [Cytophagales bacterium]
MGELTNLIFPVNGNDRILALLLLGLAENEHVSKMEIKKTDVNRYFFIDVVLFKQR